MKAPLHVPDAIGRAAIAEIDRVPWEELENAYGKGAGEGDHADVRAALARLGEDDDDAVMEASDVLFGNVCHQGTIYEATAYAVPFLAAYGAGAALEGDDFEMIASLLATIGHAASFDAPHGSHAGSWGPGVGAATRDAFCASEAHLRTMTERFPDLAPLTEALRELGRAKQPDDALARKLAQLAYGRED